MIPASLSFSFDIINKQACLDLKKKLIVKTEHSKVKGWQMIKHEKIDLLAGIPIIDW